LTAEIAEIAEKTRRKKMGRTVVHGTDFWEE
jgi:hypothetical protein